MQRVWKPVVAAAAAIGFCALLAPLGYADGARAPKKQAPPRLDRRAIEAGQVVHTDAQQRVYRTKNGTFGVAATAPRFAALKRQPGGSYRSEQAGLTIDLAGATYGAGSAMRLAGGKAIRVSTAARLFGASELGASFDLVTRSVQGVATDDGSVRFPGALAGGDLTHRAGAGRLATELRLPRRPEPLEAGAGYETIYFEEVCQLPAGWRVQGLEEGTSLRTAVGLPILDEKGQEQARLEAPLVFEEATPKGSHGHFARSFAEIRQQQGGVLVYRVGIPAAWLKDPARRYPVVIDPAIQRGVPVVVRQDSVIDIRPRALWWNAVGVSSAAADWDIHWGQTQSWRFPPDCDFVIANGNKGTITPSSGEVRIFGSGSGRATVEHAGIDNISLGSDVNLTWPAGHVLHVVEVYVRSATQETLTIDGPAGYGFALFAPGSSSAWQRRKDAMLEAPLGSQGHTVSFNTSGFWGLVIFKDGGPDRGGTISVRWGQPSQPTFNLEATAATLEAASYPSTVKTGDRIRFTRNITRTGTLPTGSQINYAIYLSDNTFISATDHEIYSYRNAGAGQLTLSARPLAQAVPDGAYYVGLRVEVVNGESDTQDNQTYDSVTDHKVVVQNGPVGPPQVTLVSGQANAVTQTPTDFSVTPNPNVWNLIALAGDDWNLTADGVSSNLPGAKTDLVVANGNNGQVTSPTTGQVVRRSGTQGATLWHTASSLIGSSGQKTYAWSAGQVAHIFAYNVATTGGYTLDVTGLAGLSWALFAPGTTAGYRPRSQAAASGQAGTQGMVTMNQAGYWGLVLVKDGQPASAGTVQIRLQPVAPPPAPYNLAVTQVGVQGTGSPVQVAHGDNLTVDRTIAVTGQLPAGSSIDYEIYLSLDQRIDANDVVFHQASGASQGQSSITDQVAATVPVGTYYVGVKVDPIAGEQDPNDNVRFAQTQVQVTAPAPQAFNLEAKAFSVQGGPTQGPLAVTAGQAVSFAADVALTGQLPQGAAIDHTVFLSLDQAIDAGDLPLLRTQGASAGAATLSATIPQWLAAGTYYAAIQITGVQGESNTQDNEKFATLQIQVGGGGASIMVNAIAVSAGSTNGQVTINPGDTFDADIDMTLTSLPSTTQLSFKVYLSSNQIITTFDEEVYAGQATPGQHQVTCTLASASTISSGAYYVGVIIDPVPNETSTSDNDVAASQADVTVNGQTPPPPQTQLTLTVGQPEAVQSGLTFGFTPTQGSWNGLLVVADDPQDDWDVGATGQASSIRFNPDADFVLANGHAGQITPTTGDVTEFGAVSGATLVHQAAQVMTFSQPGQSQWAAGQGLLLLEVDVQQTGTQWIVLSGPQGLKAAVFAPGQGADFVRRNDATSEFDLGLLPTQIDFNVAGVWSIAIFHEAGVTTSDGPVSLDWGQAPAQGFDLAAVAVSLAQGLSLTPGQTLDVTHAVGNLGLTDSPGYVYALYLSDDQTIDPQADQKIFESLAQPALVSGSVTSSLDTVTLPAQVTNGTYYVGLYVPQLANDAAPQNAAVISQDTLAIVGGVAPGTIVRSGGGSSGGGCSLDPNGTAPGAWVLWLLAVGMVWVRRRRALA